MVDTLGMLRGVRHRFGPELDRIIETVCEPTTHVYPSGYVGSVNYPKERLEAELQDGGFSWDPVSMYHHTPMGSSTDGSWVYRNAWRSDRQLHVILFEYLPNRIDIYAHDEFSWVRHPIKHAKQVDIRREEGVAEMQRWLAVHDVGYDRDQFLRRKLKHIIQQYYDQYIPR